MANKYDKVFLVTWNSIDGLCFRFGTIHPFLLNDIIMHGQVL